MLLGRAGCALLLWGLAGLVHPESARKAEWLMRQNPEAFTLQLITVSNRTQLDKLVQAQSQPDNFASFRVQGQDRLLYVLTYGVFEDPGKAEAIRADLADDMSLAPDQFWIRRLRSVQGAIRTTLQQ